MTPVRTPSRVEIDPSTVENPEVLEFLQSVNMEKYLPKFTHENVMTLS